MAPRNNFRIVTGHIDWPKKFQIGQVLYLTGQNVCDYRDFIEMVYQEKDITKTVQEVLGKTFKSIYAIFETLIGKREMRMTINIYITYRAQISIQPFGCELCCKC